jgi:hypothetical protein
MCPLQIKPLPDDVAMTEKESIRKFQNVGPLPPYLEETLYSEAQREAIREIGEKEREINMIRNDHETDSLRKDVLRRFDTGATRNLAENKLDYEGFLSPVVLERYARYMHSHRKQKDGSLRSGDNWQAGIPKDVYAKSLIRHTFDFWRGWRGHGVVDPDSGLPVSLEELCCAIMFNVMGILHELLKQKPTEEK